LKAITENMDSAISADLNPNRVSITLPHAFEQPEGGLNAQWPTTPLEQERLLNKYRIYAARAFAYANDLNTIELDTPQPRLGIVTSGKSYLDVMEALDDLGIDEQTASDIGIRIFKVGMSWPLEPIATHQFAKGLKEILVVEEKRSVIEDQITGQLYNWPVDERPVVVGEFDEKGNDLVTNLGELTPAMVARAIGSRITKFYESRSIIDRLEFLDAKEKRLSEPGDTLTRTPYFCSGCPHNTSTKVPDGSFGLAGIGCHYMVKWMDRRTETFTQMGGEGASWIGQAPFTETKHVFQNIGDGTYFHSGILAIRAAIASGVNITYKLLYNDAVAMTGGQPVDGSLKVPDMIIQLQGEGVKRLAVVAEDYDKAKLELKGIRDITIHPKSEFDRLQVEIREVPGTSVIIFDQTCASEKRRRRKRGLMPESATRVFIHPDICEGCGDCSTKSNCLSVLPKKTELGVKRQIDQNACNGDFGCLQGFCPSFITVTGGKYRSGANPGRVDLEMVLPEPEKPGLERPWNVLVTGIGGTGVLTVGSVMAMAAHLEGKGCSTLNQTGLAQKFGSVVSHVRIAQKQDDILAVRVPDGDADLLLGCDLVVSASAEALARLDPERSHSIVNSYENPTADFIHDEHYRFPAQQMQSRIEQETGKAKTEFVNATRIARDLLGNAIGSNLFLLGYAYQKGLVPVGEAAIFRAIELNGVAIEFNQQAFTWGRRAAINLDAVESQAGVDEGAQAPLKILDEIVQWRYDYLVKYQDKAYAERYLELVNRTRKLDGTFGTGETDISLGRAVASNYFKLMAYKDEYEIARLMSSGSFLRDLQSHFEGGTKLEFHMAPPLLSRKDPLTGHLLKRRFPGFTLKLFAMLAKLKHLRGTRLDIFGKTEERKTERRLVVDYEEDVSFILDGISESNYTVAVALASLPEMIKGFGHVKMANIEKFQDKRIELKKKFREPELSLVVNH
jgi:indolepyruvate ferredoxin oxidoreductase